MHKTRFFREFIKAPKTTGSIIPSSKFLINSMLKNIDFSKADVIVELGPGNGCITKEILKNLKKDSVLLTFEINNDFCNILRDFKDERMVIINDSAENISKNLKRLKSKKADYIISSLPLTNLSKPIYHKILSEIENNLSSNGLYIQYQYSLKALSDIKTKFSRVNIRFTPFNIPPAFIYISSI